MIQTPTLPEKRTVHPPTDGGFRVVVIVSTAVIFAAVFGWLACIERKESGEVEFHWQASAWLWIAIGIASTVYFWRQVWPAQNDSPTGARHRVIKGWAALLIPSLMWMAYPLRFISGQQLLNVCIGLAIATTVLTLGGWMVYRLIKGFSDEEISQADVASTRHPDPGSAAVNRDANPPPTV